MNNPIAALKNFVRPSGLKLQAADPDKLEKHARFLQNGREKGKEGPVYVKKGLSGKYLSFTPPLWNKEKSLAAYKDLLTNTLLKYEDDRGNTTPVGDCVLMVYNLRQQPQTATIEEATQHTRVLHQLVINLAAAVQEAKASDSPKAPPSLGAKKPSPAMAEKKIAAVSENTQGDLPEFPNGEELGAFQRDLQRGHISRPVYADVTRFVDHLNHTRGTISDRKLPRGERNEADDLLSYIAQNVTAKHTYQDGHWQEGRQTNTFGGRTFHSRLEAARFLFTETNFFKKLNPLDAAVYMGIYQDLIKEAKQAQQEQQRLG